MKNPKIFDYTNYRDALRAFADFSISQGESYRSLAGKCGSKSPNFLQAIIKGQRNLSPAAAIKVTKAFSMSEVESQYFQKLLQLDRTKNKKKGLEDLRSIAVIESEEKTSDQSILARWEYALIYELARVPSFKFTAENIKTVARAPLTLEQIEGAIAFLKSKGWITVDEEFNASQKSVKFKVIDDCRQIDVQSNHLTNIELSKHRLNDPTDRREYRGYTVAIPSEKFADLKELARNFTREVKELTAGFEEVDQVIQVQLCIFELSKKS